MFFFTETDNNFSFKPISIESAYLLVLNNHLKEADAVFQSMDSPRAKWGISLIQILNGYMERFPTYFEIRNFYEIDMDFFLKNNKIEYVEQMLGATDFLADINQEVNKFAARVMFENKLPNAAKKYLDKSKSIFYKDPELHYMYAKFYISTHENSYAHYHLDECLKILPDYYPAKKLKESLV